MDFEFLQLQNLLCHSTCTPVIDTSASRCDSMLTLPVFFVQEKGPSAGVAPSKAHTEAPAATKAPESTASFASSSGSTTGPLRKRPSAEASMAASAPASTAARLAAGASPKPAAAVKAPARAVWGRSQSLPAAPVIKAELKGLQRARSSVCAKSLVEKATAEKVAALMMSSTPGKPLRWLKGTLEMLSDKRLDPEAGAMAAATAAAAPRRRSALASETGRSAASSASSEAAPGRESGGVSELTDSQKLCLVAGENLSRSWGCFLGCFLADLVCCGIPWITQCPRKTRKQWHCRLLGRTNHPTQ